jgi:glutamate carboxypeptidase
MLLCLRQAVEIESPSHSKSDVDRMAQFFANELERCHGEVRILAHRSAGSAVRADFFAQGGSRRDAILLLGHTDTVWDRGTLAHMPFRVRGGRAYGPGILDMKSGIVCGLWAIRALQALGVKPHGPVRFFLNSDEEVSSVAFRRQLMTQARRSRAVLVLEPAAAGGALKTSRKGVGEFQVMVHGRAAHAGIDPEAGVNAVTELARQIVRIESFARPKQGLTLSAGVISGGTRSNVVPERASARIDVRVTNVRDQKVIEGKLRELKPFNPEARLEVSGGVNRPPMERIRAVPLYAAARKLGQQMGMELPEARSGGGSDGNFTAALGIPTLDGLGGVGGGAHALHEHVVVQELARRAALIAALLASL